MARPAFKATTRGGRYSVEVDQDGSGGWKVVESTRGVSGWTSTGWRTCEDAVRRARRYIEDARMYDGIVYMAQD